jgi:DNA mismatch repair ATPase MutS
MRIAGLPKSDSGSLKPASSERWTGKLVEAQIQPLRRMQKESESLELDDSTLKDLEILSAEGGAKSLFTLCNFTRTKGGGELLKQRMRKPWSDRKRISETQLALRFISANRKAFDCLPSYITTTVEKYQRETIMLVTQINPLEFMLGAFALRSQHERHYRAILRDVQVACTVIRELREFAVQDTLDEAPGELSALLLELKQLLNRPWIKKVPATELDEVWFWTTLRIDQILRLHEQQSVLRLLQIVYEIDALVSMADATQHLRFTYPELLQGDVRVVAQGLTHPQVPNAVANPVSLSQEQRVLFLTGPNMAGKTTYLRAFATALYFAHLGMGVPATSFAFVPVNRLFSSISLNDDLHAGISYFRAEALRMKAIAEAISDGHRVVAVMDEPFKGTNVRDAFDVSLEILKRIAGKANCLFMFSSHLIELEERFSSTDLIANFHFEAREAEGTLAFDFLLRPGVSKQRLGVRVLEEEGVFRLLD